jgi:hypothetical protein
MSDQDRKLSSPESFQLLGQQDHPCWRQACENIYGLLKELCPKVAKGNDLERREELVQETFMKLLSPRLTRDLASAAQVRNYITGALRNNLDSLRKADQRCPSLQVQPRGSDETKLNERLMKDPRGDARRPGETVGDREQLARLEDEMTELEAEVEGAMSSRRTSVQSKMRLAFREMLDLSRELRSSAEIIEEEAGARKEDLGERVWRNARDRVHQRHCRARKRFLEYVVKQSRVHPESQKWSRLVRSLERLKLRHREREGD